MAVWQDILEARYDKVKLKVLIRDNSVVEKKDSIWWRDLIISDNYENLNNNHFSGEIECTKRNGVDILFWYACWTGSQSLVEAIPEMFRITENHLAAVN